MIFREGDTTQEAYRILKGRVEISIAGEGKSVILAQLGEGDIFGEMAMVDERPRSASAQALEVTECEVLTAENFNEAVLQRPEILIPYLASFFERLRTGDERVPEGEGAYRRVPIDTGITSDEFIEVKSGLEAGQQVVARGAFLLKSELLLEDE